MHNLQKKTKNQIRIANKENKSHLNVVNILQYKRLLIRYFNKEHRKPCCEEFKTAK